MRFRPPPVSPSAELDWVVDALFRGPGVVPRELDSGALRLLAERLGAAAALGARMSEDGSPDLDPGLARSLRQAHRRAAAGCLLHERNARELAALAPPGAPLVFLKGFALHVAGRAGLGARPFADLDLLAPRAAGEELFRALEGAGYRAVAGPPNDHHLPPLRAPAWGWIEIHYRLRGLRVGAEPWATAEELVRLDLVRPVDRLPGCCFVPRRHLLAAHLLVHGIAHHGWRPETYPALRMLSDLAGLLSDREAWAAFTSESSAWVAESLTAVELAAAEELTLALAGGEPAAAVLAGELPASVLLRHLLAGALVPGYGRSLAWRHTWGRLRDARRQGRLGAYLRDKLAPPAGSGPGRWSPLRLGRRIGHAVGGLLGARTRGSGSGGDR